MPTLQHYFLIIFIFIKYFNFLQVNKCGLNNTLLIKVEKKQHFSVTGILLYDPDRVYIITIIFSTERKGKRP
jgi:hypothetical protein